jgi:hypothetical protein
MTITDIGVERQRLILGHDADRFDPGIGAVAQRKINDPVAAAKGDSRLGEVLGQDAQTRTLPACEDQRDDLITCQKNSSLIMTITWLTGRIG